MKNNVTPFFPATAVFAVLEKNPNTSNSKNDAKNTVMKMSVDLNSISLVTFESKKKSTVTIDREIHSHVVRPKICLKVDCAIMFLMN